jgi:hypothetical protein
MFVQKLVKPALAAAAFLGLAALAPAANAGTDVDVYFGLGGAPGWGYYDSGYGYDMDPGYYRPHRPHYLRISCWQGKDQVQWAGFHRVRAIDCDGSRYAYKARKHGDSFIVSVSSRSGRIVSVREIY